jgi:hypothetical protein
MNMVYAWLLTKIKSVDPKTWAIVIVVLAIFFLGMYCQKKIHRCPVVKVGTETVVGTIVNHPTIKDTIPKQDIKTTIKQIISHQRKHDTPKRDSTTHTHDTPTLVMETQHCYSFRYEAPDHTIFVPRLCSREFKITPPSDMTGDVDYTPHPDTPKTVYRVDTISSPAKRFYIGLGGGGGYGIDATGRKGWNANVGIQLGVALKQY